MTLALKSSYYKKSHHKLSSIAAIIIIIIACFGVGAIITISTIYRSTIFTSLLPAEDVSSTTVPIPATDLGSVNGIVMSSDGLPVSGASVLVYKHTGLTDSADKNPGYSTLVTTNSDGAYLFNNLPSGVYKFTVTYPDGFVQTIDNYAIWPSSSSSYNFGANSLLTG